MEKMSAKELETLKALQAKQKRVQRAEAEFFEEADARKDELLARWGIVLRGKAAPPAENPTPSDHTPTIDNNPFDISDLS